MTLTEKISVAIQTNDATPTVLFNQSPSNNTYFKFSGTVFGIKDDSTEMISGELFAEFLVDGSGNLVTIASSINLNKSSNFTSCDIAISVDGSNNMIITVTGKSSTDINWDTNINMLQN